ncbi:MAG: hypothetical protein HOV79_20660 [Hamadaea sp.]|nr:hypothetical protein [Hamadaea sp.]
MNIPLAVQVAIAAAGLATYLALSIAYRRRWDAALRAALGRRMGLRVGWARVSDVGENPEDHWYAETDGPLARQAWQGAVVRAADLAALVVLGVLPPVALLGLAYLAGFHAAVLGGTAFLVIPVFGIFWSRRRADA